MNGQAEGDRKTQGISLKKSVEVCGTGIAVRQEQK
jgi:hypothetical protein